MNIHPKVYWPAVVSGLMFAGTWTASYFWHVEIPGPVVAAVQGALVALAGYAPASPEEK